jgi:hypothetical protein
MRRSFRSIRKHIHNMSFFLNSTLSCSQYTFLDYTMCWLNIILQIYYNDIYILCMIRSYFHSSNQSCQGLLRGILQTRKFHFNVVLGKNYAFHYTYTTMRRSFRMDSGETSLFRFLMVSYRGYSIWAVKLYWLDKHFAIYGQWTRDSNFYFVIMSIQYITQCLHSGLQLSHYSKDSPVGNHEESK